MIVDERLRDLFRLESDDYLQQLDDGLLQLERRPDDDGAVEALFRAAHSLKGAAHMLGFDALEILAHRLEEMLNAARRDAAARSAEHVVGMLQQLDGIRSAVAHALMADEPSGGAAGAANSGGRPLTVADGPAGSASLAREPSPPSPDGSSPEAAPRPFSLDAVRVESNRLDVLLNNAGELTVTRTRVLRRLNELDALIDYCEELRREAATRLGDDAASGIAQLERLAPLETMLSRLRAELGEDSARLDSVTGELTRGIREMRLLPLANIFRLFPRMVQDLARSREKSVELTIEGEDASADKRILEGLKDPLMHLLRNAVDHGIESAQERRRAGKPPAGRIRVRASRTDSAVEIEVSDDGRGLDEQAIAQAALGCGIENAATLAAMPPAQVRSLIFRSGLTTMQRVTDVSGRGIGLDVVRTNVERLKGSLAFDSVPGRGLDVRLRVPVTLVTARVLIVEVDGRPYALPIEHVLGSRMLASAAVLQIEGREAMVFDGNPLLLGRLDRLLELPGRPGDEAATDAAAEKPAVVVATGAGKFALMVDALLDEQEVLLKPQSALLERVRNVAGATILDSGAVCVVLNPEDLFVSVARRPGALHAPGVPPAVHVRKRVLLAEDSITTRTRESRILVEAGYDVVTAVDGLDAVQKLALNRFDAVVTDVNMPNLDGLELARRIRSDARHADLPVILVTSLASKEDRLRGLDAGANAYITKAAFDQRELIDCLERLT